MSIIKLIQVAIYIYAYIYITVRLICVVMGITIPYIYCMTCERVRLLCSQPNCTA